MSPIRRLHQAGRLSPGPDAAVLRSIGLRPRRLCVLCPERGGRSGGMTGSWWAAQSPLLVTLRFKSHHLDGTKEPDVLIEKRKKQKSVIGLYRTVESAVLQIYSNHLPRLCRHRVVVMGYSVHKIPQFEWFCIKKPTPNLVWSKHLQYWCIFFFNVTFQCNWKATILTLAFLILFDGQRSFLFKVCGHAPSSSAVECEWLWNFNRKGLAV